MLVKAISANKSNNRNLLNESLIEPARIGANILIRGIKHSISIALKLWFFNLVLYDSMREDDPLVLFFMNELPFFERK